VSLLFLLGLGLEDGPGTLRVSVADDGSEAELMSSRPSLSGDGRLVVFESDAPNLVTADTNGLRDVFARDLARGRTLLLSADPDGGPADAASGEPSLSADGRVVAFSSFAENLIARDGNRERDVFVRELASGLVERVAGGNGASFEPAISGDGRRVAFTSRASTLAPGDTNREPDVFLHDRATGTTRLVSASGAGASGKGASGHPALSADGAWVVFASDAADLVPDDLNRSSDVFLYDVARGSLERVSVDVNGRGARGDSGRPAISADGRFVAFESGSSGLVPGDRNRKLDVFVRDRATGRLEIASVSAEGLQGDGDSSRPALSADGRFVAFQSRAANLVPGIANHFCAGPRSPPQCPDVYLRDRGGHRTLRVSVADDGSEGNDGTFSARLALSAGGRVVAFASLASNLVPGDTNDDADVFIRELW
jgi:Tol biopolymer transport system component